jgi:hypothetical protein
MCRTRTCCIVFDPEESILIVKNLTIKYNQILGQLVYNTHAIDLFFTLMSDTYVNNTISFVFKYYLKYIEIQFV